MKWVDQRDKNEPVDFPDAGYKRNDLGKLAQKFYSDYETLNYPASQDTLDKTVTDILNVIELKSNVELYETTWYDKWTLGRMI